MGRLFVPFRVFWLAFRTWWDDAIPLLLINLLWLASWLTIILGPPATLGMVHATAELSDGYALSPREMYVGARSYFSKSWVWMLSNLVVVSVIVANLLFYGSIEEAWGTLVLAIFSVLLLFWFMVQFYALPFLILQEEKSLRQAWKNGLLTALASPFFTLVIFLIVALLLLISVIAIFPVVLGTGVFLAILGHVAVRERLETFNAILASDEGVEGPSGRDAGDELN